MRYRRYISRKGPLIVYGTEGSKIVKAFRNIPGVVVASVVVANGREEKEQFSPPLVPLEQGERRNSSFAAALLGWVRMEGTSYSADLEKLECKVWTLPTPSECGVALSNFVMALIP
uniref:Uncharacterized protein n=1 Tax=Nelumbo nucifera TaxID=4432 RepID=A0A822XI29_NELNU|nr:TPA_asm: hypothetical protein HUJ06_021085 [Nelumbo nucifera]